jgi:hypothetical protein
MIVMVLVITEEDSKARYEHTEIANPLEGHGVPHAYRTNKK